jgi:hypothetical protein
MLPSVKLRLFLCSWIVFSLHFGTNTVREHFPAFSLIDGTMFRVDRYKDFHSDIFVHKDGHAYIGNSVVSSVIAAVPLFLFDPALDRLEAYEKDKLREQGPPSTEYRVKGHPNSRKFFDLAKQAGLTLRFGASAAITSVFLMAPLSALMVVLMFQILLERGVRQGRAVALAVLFGFGTPVFFRSGVLNHNMILMYATFVAFHLIWVRPGETGPPSLIKRTIAGFLCGLAVAFDYSGAVPLLALFGYLLASRWRTASIKTTVLDSIPFVLGTFPPVLFLMFTQWSMFGNPFLPGQYWMPDASTTSFGYFANPYSQSGFRGFTLPTLDLYYLNLFDPAYGMYLYGPLLVLGLVPVFFYRRDQLIFPRAERLFAAAYFVALLTFCAANQYSRIQANSGFRYLVPLVPIIFLAASDHLARISRFWLGVIAIPVLIHSWVISMVREPVPLSWQRVLSDGIQFPWLTTLRLTSPEGSILTSPWVPVVVGAFTALLVAAIWMLGRRDPEARITQASWHA